MAISKDGAVERHGKRERVLRGMRLRATDDALRWHGERLGHRRPAFIRTGGNALGTRPGPASPRD
ncbi:hypothetical protein [Streptomyces sp. NPDC047985]|uniref:hypothetical protein n=1 Tax=unclassified Streptomyces TaxID=2593676 RepID=UPI003430B874